MATRHDGPHEMTVSPYETPLGTRWRWDCTCEVGSGYGFHSQETAQEYADEHPEHAARVAAMWEAAEARRRA